jgi:tetratricopeptide (TPR) repeat protein
MEEKYNSEPNPKQLIRDYEDQLKNELMGFFPLEHFEIIIDYYTVQNRFKDALKASSIAIERYPFSTELKFLKAQILSNLGQHNKALELLDSALIFQPNDEEILLVKGKFREL